MVSGKTAGKMPFEALDKPTLPKARNATTDYILRTWGAAVLAPLQVLR